LPSWHFCNGGRTRPSRLGRGQATDQPARRRQSRRATRGQLIHFSSEEMTGSCAFRDAFALQLKPCPSARRSTPPNGQRGMRYPLRTKGRHRHEKSLGGRCL
jgi:hypothetical protein